jgi:uncharacterized protein (TIGR02271 family)
MRFHRDAIVEGAIVRSLDGEKLGKVIQCGSETFVIEKGFFFPKDYLCRYEDIADIRDGEIYLSRNRDELLLLEEGADTAGYAREGHVISDRADLRADEISTREDIRVPVIEEEVTAEKQIRERGAVRIHKEVRTEERQVTVPVMREEVSVERVPASGPVEARPGDTAFTDETITVPVREEVVEVTKRPVVREEVRISKDVKREERNVSVPVRKEIVDVEEDADLHIRRNADTRPGLRATEEEEIVRKDDDLDRDY